MAYMFVTLLTSQPPMGWLNAVSFLNMLLMSVTPLVQVIGRYLEGPAATSERISAPERLVYLIPATVPVSPTATAGHMIVVPFAAK